MSCNSHITDMTCIVKMEGRTWWWVRPHESQQDDSFSLTNNRMKRVSDGNSRAYLYTWCRLNPYNLRGVWRSVSRAQTCIDKVPYMRPKNVPIKYVPNIAPMLGGSTGILPASPVTSWPTPSTARGLKGMGAMGGDGEESRAWSFYAARTPTKLDVS